MGHQVKLVVETPLLHFQSLTLLLVVVPVLVWIAVFLMVLMELLPVEKGMVCLVDLVVEHHEIILETLINLEEVHITHFQIQEQVNMEMLEVMDHQMLKMDKIQLLEAVVVPVVPVLVVILVLELRQVVLAGNSHNLVVL